MNDKLPQLPDSEEDRAGLMLGGVMLLLFACSLLGVVTYALSWLGLL